APLPNAKRCSIRTVGSVATTVLLPDPPRRRRRVVVPVLVIAALVATVIAVLIALKPGRGGGPPGPPRFDYPMLDVTPGEGLPFAAVPTGKDWPARLAKATDIPDRT